MIVKYNRETEFYTEEGCYINELVNDERDNNCSIARARVRPGVTTQLHSLDGTIERYVVLSGEGTVVVGANSPARVGTLDVVLIPAGVSQRITNTGKVDLVFLAICTPRFHQEVYRNLE